MTCSRGYQTRLAFLLLGVCWAGCGGITGEPDRAPVKLGGAPLFAVKARSEWPTAGWKEATPEEVGMDAAALARLEAYAMSRQGDEQDRRGVRTNALVVVKDGKIVLERYARGYTKETPLLVWSVTKSIANSLVGIAVREGKMDLNASAGKYYKPLDRPGHRDIRVTDLLRMSSGLDWNETYESSPLFSSVMAMLYTRGRGDMARFVSERPLAYPPGAHWSYSSGDTNLLMAALGGAMSKEEYAEYPWRALFDRLGMKKVTLERDAAGTFVGSSYLYITARDLAKWAFLYLNDGVWEGERLLPEGWVAYSLTMAPAYYQTEITSSLLEDNPGAQFYLNLGDPGRKIAPPWPEAPPDTFAASGHWGKSVFVIPSLDLIAVRLGDDREYGCHHEGEEGCVADPSKAYSKRYFLKLLVGAVKR